MDQIYYYTAGMIRATNKTIHVKVNVGITKAVLLLNPNACPQSL